MDTAYGSPYKGQTIRQSDVRPEAFSASFQTSEGEHQHAFLRKDRFEIRDTRYEKDAEDYYKRGICHIRMFPFVLTKWILLSTIR